MSGFPARQTWHLNRGVIVDFMARDSELAGRRLTRRVELVLAALALSSLLMLLVGARPAAANSFKWSVILTGQGSDDAVACPATNDCVVGGGFSSAWETTFNPFSPGSPAHHVLPSSNSGAAPLACPSTTQCTAIVDNNYEDTFNPASPGTPTEAQIDNAPLISSDAWGVQDLSCPSQTQCTGVDSQSSEVTFNPQSPPASQNPQVIDTNTASNSNYEYYVSCPSVSQCTAIDGANTAITFNPGASPWTSRPTIISTHAFASTFNIGGVDCPSTTQCTDVYTYPGSGTNSYEVTFNPQSPGNPTPVALSMYANSGGATGSFVKCPSTTQCTVSGADNTASGNPYEVTFNPQAPGTPSGESVPEDGALSCPSVSECVMTDGYGRVILGTPSTGGGGGGGTPSAGQTKVVGKAASVHLGCPGSGTGQCHFTLRLSAKAGHKLVKVGSASASLSSGKSTTVTVHLNAKGKNLLKHHSPLKVKLTVSAARGSGSPKVILTKNLKFKK